MIKYTLTCELIIVTLKDVKITPLTIFYIFKHITYQYAKKKVVIYIFTVTVILYSNDIFYFDIDYNMTFYTSYQLNFVNYTFLVICIINIV